VLAAVFFTYSDRAFAAVTCSTGSQNALYISGAVADQFAILSQIRLFSTKRFQKLIVVMPDRQFMELTEAFKNLLPKSEIPHMGEVVADGIPSGD